MAEQHTIRRLENHTSRVIILPPTTTFPKGIRLLPGLNTVPVLYMDELTGYETEPTQALRGSRRVNVPARKPGAELLEQLQKPVQQQPRPDGTGGSARSFHRADGVYRGPQITIFEDVMSHLQDGPPPPDFLPQKKEQAMAIIGVTTDKAALKRWSTQGRGEIAQAAASRLLGLTTAG